MSNTQSSERFAEVRVDDLGGIDETAVSFSPGVTALTGRNATNRTSLLRALMAALGSDRVSLKGDAEAGSVELALDGTTYTRTLEREHGTTTMGGEPYLDDAERAELFAFLLEDNDARRAVAREGDLREVIMRPVDTDAIRADIDRLEAEKRELDDRLDQLSSLEERRESLDERRADLDERIETTRAALAETETAIEDADSTVDDSRERKAEFEAALDDLKDTRSNLDDVRYRIDTERESIAALEAERDEHSAELAELSEAPAEEGEIDAAIERLREHKQSLDSTVSQLQRVLQFNEAMLDGDDPELQQALQDATGGEAGGADGGELTDELLAGGTTVCWTCGSEVQRDAIDGTLERLRSLRREKATERNEVSAELDELTSERSELRAERDRRERLDDKLAAIDDEIDDREDTIEELEAERDRLETAIDDLEADVEALEGHDRSELLDLHREANRLELELGRLEGDREEMDEKIESLDAERDERERLQRRRSALTEELADLRTRIEQLEAAAVEAFNDHMETVLGVLDYENIARIWIERTERDARDGRRTVENGAFDLHVVRRTDEGATYEDTVEHLSESEREVTGLVFALAGYLVHDLHETLPVMVLDSLEALDPERVAALVDYFAAYADYLVVALLPEDAAALDADHQRITAI